MVIAVILGIVLLLLAAGGGVLVFFAVKKRNKLYRYIGIGVAAASFLLFLFLPFSIHTVNPGEVAVVKHLGKATQVRTSGTYFDFWLTDQYDRYDAKVQNLEIRDTAYSRDAQTMDIAMTVQFKIRSEDAISIAEIYGNLDVLSNRIQSVAVEKTKSKLSSYSAMTIIETRETISPQVESVVKQAVDDSFYVNVETVVLTNIDFSDAFEQTVEDKMIAEQEKLKAEYEKETAIVNAEKELEVAKLLAEARIETAKGDAEAQLLAAQAEANALKAQSVEIARALGFEIFERTVEEKDEEGNVVKTEIEYTINFEGKTDAEIKLISEYLKYVKYLESWNGELPGVLVTEGGGSVILPLPDGNTAGKDTPAA